ncbi:MULTISPECIES: DUF3742 family protein [Pseudomonas]|uniref:DUF3742 family protein n=1 Tax=Pseudomonas TaxID=286 RepID=UPI0003FF9CC5|nr:MULTISPECIES: DUF3742 family protein [Pseudomonas]TEK52639.1 DUF3742 family protein [Pseudomonas aeruginosa]TEK58454.1 DUF3742 family protein [Pseudomonas aeruginosa]TEK71220.1 DUF3742 family protein [Pseudomonas aeruginosa]TEK86047.1 DUF3742 family protein [Pseudomonas aeruginosa]TEK86760.1 DUF3742 family protein [Pseudomonas aeruginosa]
MGTRTRISNAERFGRWLGRGWRAYVRRERRVSGWLVGQGVPTPAVAVLIWGVKLAALAVLLYTAFWLALLLVFGVAAAWVARNTDWDEPQPEWRSGNHGFGHYHPDGSRIDPHDPNDEM